jgi:hypothetical protein
VQQFVDATASQSRYGSCYARIDVLGCVVGLPSMAGLVSKFNCARSSAVAVWLVLFIQLPERKVP